MRLAFAIPVLFVAAVAVAQDKPPASPAERGLRILLGNEVTDLAACMANLIQLQDGMHAAIDAARKDGAGQNAGELRELQAKYDLLQQENAQLKQQLQGQPQGKPP